MARGERETLLALQQALSEEQFQSLKYLLEERLPLGVLGPATRPELCSLLLQRFPGQALRLAADLLRQIHRHDLLRLYQLPGAEEEEETPGEKGDAGHSSVPSGCGEDAGCRRLSLPVASSPPSLPPRRLTEKDLIQIAQKLGREWQEVGIGCLGLERSRLEQIREDNPGNVVMQSFEMLREWRRREKQEATAPRLHACLAPASLDPELHDLLQSFQGN
ncbi:CRADD protein, partial [Burhinus bistriatus]|nr:CRADD protein [Burhinus bistriatus]